MVRVVTVVVENTPRNVPLAEMNEKVRVGWGNDENFNAKNIVYISHIDESYKWESHIPRGPGKDYVKLCENCRI